MLELQPYSIYNQLSFQPGVVATLIEDRNGGVTYGVAFQLINEAALDYLNNREVALGGYIFHITIFSIKIRSINRALLNRQTRPAWWCF